MSKSFRDVYMSVFNDIKSFKYPRDSFHFDKKLINSFNDDTVRLRISVNKHVVRESSIKALKLMKQLEEYNIFFNKETLTTFIDKNINGHPYFTLYVYFVVSEVFDFKASLNGDKFIDVINYFKRFCPEDLSLLYISILNNNLFTNKQLNKIFIKLFYYLKLEGNVLDDLLQLAIIYADKLTVKTKFLIYYKVFNLERIYETNNKLTFQYLQNLLENFDKLNTYEQNVIRDTSSTCFMKYYQSDREESRKVYNKLIKLFPDKEAELKLFLLSSLI